MNKSELLELVEIGLSNEIKDFNKLVNEVLNNRNINVKFYQTKLSRSIEAINQFKNQIERMKEE